MTRNMSPKKVEMPNQDPQLRARNFEEVALGYTQEMAMEEAARCLQCKHKPCVDGCPVRIDIPAFIHEIAQGKMEEAFLVLNRDSALPAVCGRVCPQETQCEQRCVRAIKGEAVGIGRLERYAADWHRESACEVPPKPEANGHKVAVVGAGPGGLTAAGELARMGYAVTVFEALHLPGGVLSYGIPEFRLPKDIVMAEVEALKRLGVVICLNTVIGKTLTIDELLEMHFEAVFIASGAGLPRFMGIPGESLKGVYSANEYLTRINLMKAYEKDSLTPIMHGKRVAVVGGGNVAMDAARCARRLGAEEVHIVYRRGMKELPARLEEVHHAQEEGITFRMLTNPIRVLGDEKGWVRGLECVRMTLGEKDASGRARPVEEAGSNYELAADVVIIAIGTSSNPLIRLTTPGLETDRWGGIVVNGADGLTSREKVYAGGDVVTGSATVILAMGAGKDAARAIDRMIREKAE
ncbi:MAG: NADPH-dependent glutamate synthase [Clostridiales bacterium]|jgi:glutamate synthase (NADPH/NADH) small chain|nr:NADPH-dependent glutamate synthase [Clostridiales bacterium]